MPEKDRESGPDTRIPISIVTACRNSGRYIEKTILSVLGQGYPNLQYVVIDGASTDSTMSVIERHRQGIATVVSEPDAGQYHGIQKGLAICQGEVMAYLNADDTYYPWTLAMVGGIFEKFPEVEWIIGQPSYMNVAGQCIRVAGNSGPAYPGKYIENGWFRSSLGGYLQQESMFWRRSLWDKVGGLNLDYRYAADFELWTRFAAHADLHAVTVPLALFRKRPGEQVSSVDKDKYDAEVDEICGRLNPPPRLWNAVAGLGLGWEHACRMLIWKRGNLVTYSESLGEWVLRRGLRPLSRASFWDALLFRISG